MVASPDPLACAAGALTTTMLFESATSAWTNASIPGAPTPSSLETMMRGVWEVVLSPSLLLQALAARSKGKIKRGSRMFEIMGAIVETRHPGRK